MELEHCGAEDAFWHWRLGRLIPRSDSARLEGYAAAVFAASDRPAAPAAVARFLRGYVGVCWWLERVAV